MRLWRMDWTPTYISFHSVFPQSVYINIFNSHDNNIPRIYVPVYTLTNELSSSSVLLYRVLIHDPPPLASIHLSGTKYGLFLTPTDRNTVSSRYGKQAGEKKVEMYFHHFHSPASYRRLLTSQKYEYGKIHSRKVGWWCKKNLFAYKLDLVLFSFMHLKFPYWILF